MLIHTKYANLRIEYCTFNNIQYSDKMIYCDSYYTYESIYNNNYISNCNSRNSDARLIYTDSNNNEIKNNYIYFDPSISVGHAFYLEFIDNNRFINNTVINANCGHGSAIYSTSNNGKGDFIMEDCHFSNCRGTDGSIIYIDQLKNNLAIKNPIFENLQNYYQNNGDLIRLIRKNDNQELSFVDCKFRYLECDSISFESTRFEHILHKHESIGGGAISIDQSNDNKDVGIIVNNCIFKNVSDTNNGCAIYCNSHCNTISIRGSTFDQTSSSKDGNSIFIAQSNSYSVTIADCHFNDCGTQPNSYVIYINSRNFDFQDSEITFADSSKSCGCIKSDQYKEHNI
ncbi:hypothetical protein M9Y10_044437 [Tritrichomonas musculus]|uniref:Right handed beta helix domain-containing protein n=1 Tax=Tritrichomonas musculus TaxID=1915356 RepID=A0ABR2JSD4_9EUKA